jgi:hypothetical protein
MKFSSIFRCKKEDNAPTVRTSPSGSSDALSIGPGRCRVGEFRIAVRELGVMGGHITIPGEVHQHGGKKGSSPASGQRNVRPGHRFPTEAWLGRDFV